MQFWPLLAALVLAAVYALAAGARDDSLVAGFWGRRRRLSAAAGISLAYVFVDILPELALQNRALHDAGAVFFAEQHIYLLALASFVVMYGIDHIVLSRREQRQQGVERGEGDASYVLHIVGHAAYAALIGYLLVERAERGVATLAVYTLAMAVHFYVVSHALADEHGRLYQRQGHWLLAASVLGGWALGAAAPLSEAAFARLFALLAGGVVMSGLRSELPDDRSGRFWPFCGGAFVFACVLLLA